MTNTGTRVSDAEVEAAIAAFDTALNTPIMDKCLKCAGKGYHHGFGEDGVSPDWCTECGGNQYNVRPGEESRAMRAALTAASIARQSGVSDEVLREVLASEWRKHSSVYDRQRDIEQWESGPRLSEVPGTVVLAAMRRVSQVTPPTPSTTLQEGK